MLHNIQPLLNKTYAKAVSAQGIYITDENGKHYLDGSSGAITCSLGHTHPQIIPFMQKQLEKLQFVYRSQFASDEAERLATKLFELSPGKKLTHTFFVNSGTEAIETAMKMALQFWQEQGKTEKKQFITRSKSYHGITMGALSLSGHLLRRQRFESMLEKYPRLQAPLDSSSTDVLVAEFEKVIAEIGADRIAAFVAEPIVGAAGTALEPPAGYYEAFRKVCDQHEILFIADEVMTGLGRTGKWFGLQHWNADADIVAIGKSLGAGYAPIAATLCTTRVLEPIKRGSGLIMSGHTYSGHPLSCATALRVLEIVEEHRLLDHVLTIGSFLKSSLEQLQARHSAIHFVRGKGLLLGVEFDPGLKGLQGRLIERCYKNGLLIYPSVGGPNGTDENGILIAPPFITSANEASELLQLFTQSLKESY